MSTQNYLRMDLYNYAEIKNKEMMNRFKDLRFAIYYLCILLTAIFIGLSFIYQTYDITSARVYVMVTLSIIMLTGIRSGLLPSIILTVIFVRVSYYCYGEKWVIYNTAEACRHYSKLVTFLGWFLTLFPFAVLVYTFIDGLRYDGDQPLYMWRTLMGSWYAFILFISPNINKMYLLEFFGS